MLVASLWGETCERGNTIVRIQRSRPTFFRLTFLLLALVAIVEAQGGICYTSTAAASIELYGNFHAMGVIVTTTAADDPDGDATASVEYRTGSQAYQAGFPLSRVDDTRFVGSLFWLQPGTTYDVRVTFSDPDGDPLDGVTVTASGATRAEIAIPTPVNSYYIAPNGSGTTCTLAAPCSLTEGLSQAQAGDEVVLRDGVYYQGEIDLPRSGAADAPIVIRSCDGDTAILDGADPATFTWTAQDFGELSRAGGGVYRTTVNVGDTHLITANGQRLYPYQSLSDLQNLVWGVPGFYASGTTVYVRLAGDADPNGATMAVSRYNYAFYVEQDHIYFLDLTLRHYGQGSWAKAIYFNNANDNLVQGCTFAINDLGIGIKRVSHRNVIQDSEFYDSNFDWPWDAVKAGSALEGGGVIIYNPCTGRGNIIRRNTFHDYFDGFGACPSGTAGLTNETDVYENLIYRASDDGLSTDGQCSNVRIWGNTFRDVLMGISLAPVYTGPVYAIRNLIYRTGVGNNDYTGSPFKFNSGYDQSGPMYLFHNTADAVLPGNNGLYIKAPGTWDLIYARNNIWAGTDYAMNNYNTSQPVDLDYDDLYTTNPDEFVYWGSGPDPHMQDLATFQSLTGQELHGLDVAPGFAHPASGDYTLDSSSDLIDAGVVIPGINDRGPDAYQGLAPDIGAFETATCTLEGDLDGDGDVDITDIMLVASIWNTAVGDPDFNPDYDLDDDDDIDVIDIMLVAAHWGEECTEPTPTLTPTATPTPTPTPVPPLDKWSLWTDGTSLRGANTWQRRVYPELDGPTFLGPGPVGPPYTQEDFDRLAALGANYVNISHPGLFTETPPYVLDQDIQDNLDSLLSMIEQAGMFAVISARTGPGRSDFTFYWDGAGDWFDESYLNDSMWQDQAAQDGWVAMWSYTAQRYRNNPIVVGYDLMVEPNSNEVGSHALYDALEIWDPEEFYATYGGTLYDWNQLYPDITTAIRQVDSDTPILIGGNGYSAVDWLPYLEPTGDPRTVYMVHQYEPFVYTHQEPPLTNAYPGVFDTDWDGVDDQFNQTWLDNLLSTVDTFKTTHGLPVSANEFGVMRWEPGAAAFMDDEMTLFEQRGMNHALWVWDPSWEPWTQEVDAFNFRHGPDPNNHADVASSDLMDIIIEHWGRNTVRP